MKRVAMPAVSVLMSACSGCGAPVPQDPDLVVLAPELHEVSGIVATAADTAVCVQDETGALFTVGLADGRIRARATFGPRGDYEGLAQVGDSWFVLRSDGVLLELRGDGTRLREQAAWPLPWKHTEWESLAHDLRGNRLVLAPKSVDAKGKQARDERRFYAFDLATRLPVAEPFLVLSTERLAEQGRQLGLPVPIKTTERGKERIDWQLLWSEVAVTPSGGFALLSAADHTLLVVDRAGDLTGLLPLDAKRLPQPEGLSFLPDGRLLVASEGAGGMARVVTVQLPAAPTGK